LKRLENSACLTSPSADPPSRCKSTVLISHELYRCYVIWLEYAAKLNKNTSVFNIHKHIMSPKELLCTHEGSLAHFLPDLAGECFA